MENETAPNRVLDQLPNDGWLFRRILVYVISMVSLAFLAFIIYKNPDTQIALGLIALIALLNTLYMIVANDAFKDILARTAELIARIKT